MAEWEKLLNSEQLKAVKDTEGAVLVLAGAGSGKTRVLTYRIAYLMGEKGVAPENILALTFTNKAAAEMSKRVLDLVGKTGALTCTFHSFCARILRSEAEYLGYSKNFSIYDTTDCERLIKRILVEKHIQDKEAKTRALNLISKAKSECLTPDEMEIEYSYIRDIDLYAKVYVRYQELLKEANAMDFDDLLSNVYILFTNNPGVLQKYQFRFRYILVDEFQDTNRLQFQITYLLGHLHGNVFCVGDDDQSIYSWRGADVTNMTGFKKYYPNAKLYKLEQNYRSTPEILNIANKIIASNTERIGKELWTENSSGTKVEFKSAYNDRQEAEYVVETMINLIRFNGYRASDFAILTRINAITRLFEERLNMYNLPYKVFGGFKFYDRAEIKDLLAYMRLAINPRDTESMLRVINVPARGIGATSVERMLDLARERGESLLDIVLDINERVELPSALRNKVNGFRELLFDLTQKGQVMAADEFATYVVEKVGFNTYYDKTIEEENAKLQNIEEFISGAHEFVKDNGGARVQDFLQSVALVSDTDGMDDSDYVTISTIHMAKGLEFRCVFVVGLEEDIIPSSRAVREPGGLEEERRIMYVAVTRAMERLYLTYAGTRYRFNEVKTNLPSRFLREAFLLVNPTEKMAQRNDYRINRGEGGASPTTVKLPERPVISQRASVNTQKTDPSQFKLGQKVRHARFGVGRIISIEGTGSSAMATVALEGLGIKKFALSIAPLTVEE